MKITHIAGSPRKKSNSIKIANQFIETAKTKGWSANTYVLNDMNFKGCQGCYGCKKGKEKCVVNDDLTDVLNEIHETDILLISTPVYYWDVPGQLKLFIDRTYSFLKSDYMTNSEPSRLPYGKKIVFIQTQGKEGDNHLDVYKKYETIYTMSGSFKESYLIHSPGTSPEDNINENREIMAKAETLALELIKQISHQAAKEG